MSSSGHMFSSVSRDPKDIFILMVQICKLILNLIWRIKTLQLYLFQQNLFFNIDPKSSHQINGFLGVREGERKKLKEKMNKQTLKRKRKSTSGRTI